MIFIIRLWEGGPGEEGARPAGRTDTQPRAWPAGPADKNTIEKVFEEQGPVPGGLNASLSGSPSSKELQHGRSRETRMQNRDPESVCLCLPLRSAVSVAAAPPAGPACSSPSLVGVVFVVRKDAASKNRDKAASFPEDRRSVKGREEHSRAHQLADRFQQ